MKNQFLFFSLLVALASCEKDTPPPDDNGGPTVEDTAKYAGTYVGWVEKKSSGVDANGVYKNDTTYAYSVDVKEKVIGTITFEGGGGADNIIVDENGHFEFNEFNHNIEGDFKGDSLYLFTEAISGSYDPPQFYDNTQMSFSGKKVE